MRWIMALVLAGAFTLVGCGDEGSSGGSGDGVMPTITMVAWAAAANCTNSEQSDVVVTVTATDPDTAAGDLIYSGSVGGCTGGIVAAVSTISCPNVSPYPGTVMVSDPDGNDSVPVAFTVGVCDTDSCTTDPDTCG